MTSLRVGFVALLASVIVYSCKSSDPEPSGASGTGNSPSHAGASSGGKQSSGGAASAQGGRSGGAGAGGVAVQAGSAGEAGAGEGGRETGGAGAGGNGGEAPVTFGTCSPNPCLVLASGQAMPRNLVVDDQFVYWTNEGTLVNDYHDGAIMKAAIDGGEPIVVAGDQPEPLAIAQDADNLYWTTSGGPNLMKMPKAGGEVETLAPNIATWSITVDGSNIYALSFTGQGLLSVPTNGDPPKVVYAPGAGNVAYDSKKLYFATGDKDGSLTGAAGSNILVSMPKAGGDLTVLTSSLELPFARVDSLVLAAKSLYWGDSTRETVETVKLDGTGRRIIASDQHSVFGLGADSDYLYWTSDRQGGVLKAPLDGSADPVQIAKIPSIPAWGLALDADNVYVTVYGYPGMILKIKK